MKLRFLLTVAATGLAFAQTSEGERVYRKACAVCHDQANIERMPQRSAIAKMSPEAVVAALNTGVMKEQAAALSTAERRSVAEFLTGKAIGSEAAIRPGACANKLPDVTNPLAGSAWNGWGVDNANTRHQPNPGFSATDTPKLKLKWAYGFPGIVNVSSQPVVAGGRVYIGGRTIVSLDARTGCLAWEFKPDTSVRSAMVLGKPDGVDRWLVFAGDGATNVYALDASTGQLKWKTKADQPPVSRITGGLKYYGNRVYVPISSLEDGPAANPAYECCKYSGAVVTLDAVTGEIMWRTATIPDPAKLVGKTKDGHNVWGPSGASVWNSPTLDPQRNAIYFGTGNNHSNPPTATSDSVFSLDMETGKIRWNTQLTKGGDAWNVGCLNSNPNCPTDQGPDHDIGNSPILVTLKNGKRALVFGQKSGEVHAIDPDANGRVLWTKRIGVGGYLGGVEWGGTSDGVNYYVPLSDVKVTSSPRAADPKAGGGLWAFDIATGNQVWHTPPEPCPEGRANCSPAQSQAASSMPGVVFSGSVDGFIRAYSARDGKIIWSFDTIRDFTTVNGVKAKGGSLDAAGPAIAGGMLYVPSGYASWGGTAGNVLLAFSVDGR